MKILDRYIAKNFLTGYAIAFCVLIGLRIVIDLFVNIDEFAERSYLGTAAVIHNIINFYLIHSTLYFRDFAGMIMVVAAAFSLGKMIRANELIAVMASGVSLKRVIAPIIVLSLLLTTLLVIDQELIIPPLGDRLVSSQDAIPGEERYDVWFMTDENGSLICSQNFNVKTASMDNPTIITRRRLANSPIWEPTAWIEAEEAIYNPKTHRWDLVNGQLTPIARPDEQSPSSVEKTPSMNRQPIAYYASDITPKDIPVRRKSEHINLLSSKQLAALAAQKTKIKDLGQLYSQKHFRVTEPIINLVMLMVCLPVLVCRDPKSMKSAIVTSFGITAGCLVTSFVCKLLATEVVFGIESPQLWAWIPVFIFLPIAIIEIDSMKT